jgi:hypothetical protein
LFHAGGRTDGWTDRRTDMTKLTVALCNFANAPKNSHYNAEPKRNGNKNLTVCSY